MIPAGCKNPANSVRCPLRRGPLHSGSSSLTAVPAIVAVTVTPGCRSHTESPNSIAGDRVRYAATDTCQWVFEQAGRDQPISGSALRRVADGVAGAVLPRTDEGPVQHRGGGKVERVARVSQAARQAARDLATVEKSWSWAEQVAVVPDPRENLAGVREGGFEVFKGLDRARTRPLEPAGEPGRSAGFPDAGELRFDGAVIRSPVAVERVGPAASGM